MKKIFALFVAIISFSVNANAQELAAGVSFNAGFGQGFNNTGIGGKLQYYLRDNLRLEGSLNYYFEKDDVKMWDVNANAHYLFPETSAGFTFYPIVGLGLTGASTGIFKGHIDLCLNYGVGCEYPIADDLKLNFEFKGQSADNTRGILSLGLVYTFE